jgi:transcriptional regulator with XRE-family HTH domain
MTLKDLGIRLKQARIDLGYSQEEVANKAGVPRYSISKIENGKIDVGFCKLIKLCEILNIQIKL